MGKPKTKKDSSKKHISFLACLTTIVVLGLAGALFVLDTAVLTPSGVIAEKERHLILFTLLLGGLIVIPVFVMLFFVAWRYREENKKASYDPNLHGNNFLEALWWGVPLVLISILGIVTWQSSHDLDPYRALDSEVKPVKVQVVALQWRWLFIYPEENVASINELYVPVNTPINFEITSDAPMNSFWIPRLGGQVYAMTGMSTKLHLEANKEGQYEGSSANISGQGFADMRFMSNVVSTSKYEEWLKSARTKEGLDETLYSQISDPSKDHEPRSFVLKKHDLYDTIIMKYMGNH